MASCLELRRDLQCNVQIVTVLLVQVRKLDSQRPLTYRKQNVNMNVPGGGGCTPFGQIRLIKLFQLTVAD